MQCVAAPVRCKQTSLARPGAEGHVLRKCLGCGTDLAAFAEINTAHLDEPFFTPQLRARLPVLVYGKCQICGSIWASDARRDCEMLRRCYTDSTAAYWANLAVDRRLHERVAVLLARYASGRVLCDVGCGDGRLLAALPPRWSKHGLEAAPTAVELCRTVGLDVELGTPAASGRTGVYDAIVCIDTLEHMLDPVAELAGMAAMLRSGGVLLIVTGDAHSRTARLAGPWWEYLHCVGHVSALSRAALRKMLTDRGFVVAVHSGISHSASVSVPTWAAAWVGNHWRRAHGRKCRQMPYCHDHQLAIARKPAG